MTNGKRRPSMGRRTRRGAGSCTTPTSSTASKSQSAEAPVRVFRSEEEEREALRELERAKRLEAGKDRLDAELKRIRAEEEAQERRLLDPCSAENLIRTYETLVPLAERDAERLLQLEAEEAEAAHRALVERQLGFAQIPPKYAVAELAKATRDHEPVRSRMIGLLPAPDSQELAKPGTLVLCGGSGGGKTTLGCGLVRMFCERGRHAMYAPANEFFLEMEDAKKTWNKTQLSVLLRYVAPALLVVDDVTCTNAREVGWLFDLMNRRYAAADRATVLITNLDDQDFLKTVGHRLASRLCERPSEIVVCNWPDLRTSAGSPLAQGER